MRLGKKVQKVMRVGTKALAVAGAVGGAWLGVKNIQYHANQGVRNYPKTKNTRSYLMRF